MSSTVTPKTKQVYWWVETHEWNDETKSHIQIEYWRYEWEDSSFLCNYTSMELMHGHLLCLAIL